MFEVGVEIDVFRDKEELVDKARYYLSHESVRETMAARAHARAAQQYDEAKYWTRMSAAFEMRAAARISSPRARLPSGSGSRLCANDSPLLSASERESLRESQLPLEAVDEDRRDHVLVPPGDEVEADVRDAAAAASLEDRARKGLVAEAGIL